MAESFLIYGAYGYTGELIARLAVERGLRPVLAGRDPRRLGALARELGLPQRAFAVDDLPAAAEALAGSAVVLNCAGPLSSTALPLLAACLRARTHYLDLTGEWPVFLALANRDADARAVGVMVLPGVGFDVVPTDCLALHLASRLPSAKHLELAVKVATRPSRGTTLTGIELVSQNGLVRRGGDLRRVPFGWKTRRVELAGRRPWAASVPLADLVAAYHSTGIPDITTYAVLSPLQLWGLRLGRPLAGLLRLPPVWALARRLVARGPRGPSAELRATGEALVWGEATDGLGGRVVSRLRTPETYAFTAQVALLAVERALAGEARPGFQTPSRVFGADFVLGIEGVRREDTL